MRPPLLFALALACRPPEPPPEDTAPDTASAAETALPELRDERLALITIAPPVADPALPHGAEVAGLVAALLELGLADVDGVVARVGENPVSPGLSQALVDDVYRWTARTELRPAGDELEIQLTLSLDGADLESPYSLGVRGTPTVAVSALVDGIADHWLRGEASGAADERALPVSQDPYAVLLTGRSAATFYGFLPATAEQNVGNKRRDPVARALLVDPETAVGNWVAGRRALARGEAEAARSFFTRGGFSRPTSDALMADEASALLEAGHPEAAWYAFQQLEARRPDDLRFVVASARAALAAGQPAAAEERLGALGEPYASDPAVVMARISALEALHREADPAYDQLLARWAEVAPMDPEPVRRRVQLRVRSKAFSEALPLVAELSARGAPEEAARLELALLNALDRSGDAATRAIALGDSALAGRLSARDGAQSPQSKADLLLGDADPRAQAVRAAALIEAGQARAGLELADQALKQRPWLPEALAAQAAACDALGLRSEAGKARAKLCAADPRWSGCS